MCMMRQPGPHTSLRGVASHEDSAKPPLLQYRLELFRHVRQTRDLVFAGV
jgi:hypothetical protein